MTFANVGLDDNKEYLLYEFWNRKFLGVHSGTFSSQIDAHSNLLLAIHEQLNRPQFLSTNRYVSQGGAELNAEEWNPAEGELACGFKLVKNDLLTARIYAPASFKFMSARAEGATIESISNQAPPTISFVLRRSTSGEGKLFLTFDNSSEKR